MRYTCEIVINQPLARVIELFDDPDNLKHWQPGLVSFESVSGTPGEPGSTHKLTFNTGGRKMEMVETMNVHNLPTELTTTYTTKGVLNVSRNYFVAESATSTKWINENMFRFSGLFKVIGWIMPGSFPKQTHKYMELFKAFAETGASVAPPAQVPSAPQAPITPAEATTPTSPAPNAAAATTAAAAPAAPSTVTAPAPAPAEAAPASAAAPVTAVASAPEPVDAATASTAPTPNPVPATAPASPSTTTTMDGIKQPPTPPAGQ